MKSNKLIAVAMILGMAGLSACSFQKKPEEVPSAGTTEGQAVQPTPAPEAPTPPEAGAAQAAPEQPQQPSQ